MPAFDWGPLDLVLAPLDKHKERLGPLYRPLYLLSGAIVFSVLIAFMIALPIAYFDNAVFVVAAQVLLLAAYFMLLLAIKENVFDRFVFCLGLFLVLTAAGVFVSAQFTVGEFLDSGPAIEVPMKNLYAYSLVRGLGTTVWAAPMLVFYVFAPTLAKHGKRLLARRLHQALATGLVLQLGASAVLIWQEDILGRAFASVAEGRYTDAIVGVQHTYLAFSLLFVLTSFAALGAAWWAGAGDPKRLLATIVAGLLATQAFYLIAKHRSRELRRYQPAARSVGVLAYREIATRRIAFTETIFRNLGLAAWRPFAICDNPGSGKFDLHVLAEAEFAERFDEVHRDDVGSAELLCRPDG